MNGVEVTFRNCDGTPNAYWSLFTARAERKPTNYKYDNGYAICSALWQCLVSDPYERLMPTAYFAFMETQWGGCGCYSQTDGRSSVGDIVGAAIGFR